MSSDFKPIRQTPPRWVEELINQDPIRVSNLPNFFNPSLKHPPCSQSTLNAQAARRSLLGVTKITETVMSVSGANGRCLPGQGREASAGGRKGEWLGWL
jgi:hypothetical protein